MLRMSTVLFVVVLASLLCASQANWYGKRGEGSDFFRLLLQRQLDGLSSSDMDANTALAAIEQVLHLWRQHRADITISAQLKQE